MWLPSKATKDAALKPYESPESVRTQEPSLALSSVTESLLATQMWLPSMATSNGPLKP
jgi:hypothetical protein